MSPRWIGIRASAVITILGSLVTLLLAALMLFFAIVRPAAPDGPAPPVPVKWITIAMANVNLLLTAWGLATATAIFRRRPWSRISILVFAVILAFFGTFWSLILFSMPVPDTPGLDADKVSMFLRLAGSVYLALGALGIWWLVLFNRQTTKSYFVRPVDFREDPRPLSIRVIAWYLLVGVAILLPMSILRLPTFMFGYALSGWSVLAVYLPFIGIQAYVGLGLLRLRESARVAGICYFGVVAVNGLMSLSSQRQQEFMELMRRTYAWMDQPGYQPQFSWPFLLIMLLLAALPAYFLIRHRSAFRPATAQSLPPESGSGIDVPALPVTEPDAPGGEGKAPGETE
ncbi:MAG: hypothetical protein J0H49_24745 [Acidobacteria bacterium]|nr:hypothetical protein [Acidobacteriota bacterium]